MKKFISIFLLIAITSCICGCNDREHIVSTPGKTDDPLRTDQENPPGVLENVSALPEYVKQSSGSDIIFTSETIRDTSEYPGEAILLASYDPVEQQYIVYLINNIDQDNGKYMVLHKISASEQAISNLIRGNPCEARILNISYFYKIESFYTRTKLSEIVENYSLSKTEEGQIKKAGPLFGYRDHTNASGFIIYSAAQSASPEASAEIHTVIREIDARYFTGEP